MAHWTRTHGSDGSADRGPDLLRLALELLGVNRVAEVAARALAVIGESASDCSWAILHRFEGNRYEVFVDGRVGHDDLRRLAHEACCSDPWLVIQDALPAARLNGRAIFRSVGESEAGNPDLVLACWYEKGARAPLDCTRLETVAGMVHAAVESAHVIECLIEQSSRDPLTGLLNRRGILESLARQLALARRRGHPVGVIYLDVDDFKSINDRHGHGAGDEVLVTVAGRLTRMLRASDALGRLGGDEFLVVLDDSDLANARRVARRLGRAIADEPVRTPAGNLPVRLAHGAASLEEGLDQNRLLERADRRMLSQKKRRRASETRATARPARLAGGSS